MEFSKTMMRFPIPIFYLLDGVHHLLRPPHSICVDRRKSEHAGRVRADLPGLGLAKGLGSRVFSV